MNTKLLKYSNISKRSKSKINSNNNKVYSLITIMVDSHSHSIKT